MAFVFNVEENQDKIDELCEFIDKKKDIICLLFIKF